MGVGMLGVGGYVGGLGTWGGSFIGGGVGS